MLAIRMQRTGRKKHSTYRVVVQDSRVTPTSGKNVAMIGNYDPHTKVAVIDKEKVKFYLDNGAQPSPRAAVLFKSEGIKLPNWVNIDSKKNKSIKNTEKLRKNRAEEPEAKPVEESKEAQDNIAEDTPEVANDDKSDTTAAEVENSSDNSEEDVATSEKSE